MSAVRVVALALAIDLAFGDPSGRLHPVAWLGSLHAYGRRRGLGMESPAALLLAGGALTLGVAALAAAGAAVVARLARDAGWAGVLVDAIALKTTFSLRGLARAGGCVARALRAGDLAAARNAVGVHLVSRPTAALDEGRVASAAVESVAENLTDSVLAPILFFLGLGLPGAFAYRAINTADAMLGYRDGRLEYFGKVAARLDDALNLVPARMAGLALVLAALLCRRDGLRAGRTMWREHARTASPNAGWTMAAMAGALGVTLEKPGAYRLGRGPFPGAGEIEASVRIMAVAAAISVAFMSVLKSVP